MQKHSHEHIMQNVLGLVSISKGIHDESLETGRISQIQFIKGFLFTFLELSDKILVADGHRNFTHQLL